MELFKIVAFKLGEEEYGLEIEYVKSIERIHQVTRVPNAPEYVKGVINLRGNVTPIIDLRSMLSQGEANYTENSRVIITKFDDIELGLIVDQTSNVIDIDPQDIEAPSAGGIDSNYIGGIAKVQGRLISLIKLAELVGVTSN
ncbi:chemotaxis protein CheW [Neobacillus ginsengisoli]|uniref:Purine-binding chemotaxis protein CheW n=1 Tax=Neobacillus ginsengisoli TaxID=904295 RepID=A0ABT9XVI1_9BACI|nr:chemotaxis protein CheW [Neobacillus ginsengisoli]MDQ0199579.1 purine-binding chemotaxis protein CheW [Neobacillus ginsengisoli]